MTSWALDELAWPEVGRRIASSPRLLLPIGALEQHGPHLPLGTNTRIAHAVARAVGERLEILVAPTFSYGVTLPGGPFAGRAGLGRKTLHRAINELLAYWEDHGIEDFSIVTAHRYEPHLEALLMALTASAEHNVYDLYQIDTSDLLDTDPEREHAGELETSLILHLAPDSVTMVEASDFVVEARRLRKYTSGRIPTPPPESRGVVGHPERATAAKGAAVFQRYVDSVAGALSGSSR